MNTFSSPAADPLDLVARRLPASLLVLCACLSLPFPAARAVNADWQVTTGDWGDGANWDTGTVPGSGEGAHLYNNGTAHVTDAESVSFFTVGTIATSTRTTVEVSGGGDLSANFGFTIAALGGRGTLRITDGGTVSSITASTVYVGRNTDSVGTIILSNGGTLALNGGLALGFSGGTGILQIGEGGAAGTLTATGISGGVDGSGSGQIIFNHNETSYAFGIQIGEGGNGAKALTVFQNGSGTTRLTGANTYTGGTVLNAGVLSVSDNVNLGAASGTLAFDGGTLQITGAGFTMNRATTLNAGGGTFDITTGTLTQQGVITDAGSLIKTGAGTLTLTGDNTYTGGTTVTAGLIEFSSANNFGTGNITLDGGGLRWAAGNTTDISSRLNAIGSNFGVFDTNGNDVAFAGNLSGTGLLIKTGAGTLTLSGANTQRGFGVENGTLVLASTGAAGTTTYYDIGYAEGSGSTIRVNAGVTVSKSLSFDDGATLENHGIISGQLGFNSSGAGGGTVINTGTITATSGFYGDGVYVQDGFGSVTNTGGTITAQQGNGIWMKAGGSVLNEASGTISTSGSDSDGIWMQGASGEVQNLTGSTITGRYNGVTLSDGGSVTNSGGSTIQTSGTGAYYGIQGASTAVTVENLDTSIISGRRRGVYLNSGGSVLNEGTITGALTSGSNNAGIYFNSVAASLVNKGTINGGVILSNHAHSVSLFNGSVINGVLNMGTSTGTTLTLSGEGNQLYSAAVTGATTFRGALKKTGSGVWTLNQTLASVASTEISAGALLVNQTLSGAVTVKDGGTLGGSGTLSGAVTVENGGILSAGNSPGNLTVGSLTLSSGSLTRFELGAPSGTPGVDGDLISVTGNLTFQNGALLDLETGVGFGTGTYRIFNYGTSLTGDVSKVYFATGPAGYNLALDTSAVGQVNLVVNYEGLQFWNGGQTTPDGSVHGGAGTWDASTANWTVESGNASATWGGLTAVFGGPSGGTVTITDDLSVAGLQFATDGYTLAEGGGSLAITASDTELRIDAGLGAIIGVDITGAGGIVKTGEGTIVLSGDNAYTGGTTLAAGTLELGHNNALGTGALIIMDGTTLSASAPRTIGNDLVVNGDFNVYPGGTLVGLTAFALNGSMDLTGGDRTITNISDFFGGDFGELRIDGVISNGGLTFAAIPDSYAFFRLTGAEANTYTGDTVVGTGVSLVLEKSAGVTAIAGNVNILDDGVVVIEADEQIADTATVTVTGIGRLQVGAFNDVTETIGTLAGDGEVALKDNDAGGTLRVGSGTFSGSITGGVEGGGSLEKYGSGVLVLSGDSTYLGDTLVGGGSLLINGSLGNTSVTVADGALLGGSGTITGEVTVQSGGILAPGNSPGILTVGSLQLDAGSITRMEINGTAVAGVDYDQIRVTGEATLGGTLELITGGGYTLRNGDTFVLIDADVITEGSDFSAVNGLGNALVFKTTITDDYTLEITAVQTDFTAFATTPNQQAVTDILDSDWADPALADVVDYLNGLPGSSLPGAFDLIAPEEYAALPNLARNNTRAMWSALRNRLAEVRAGASGWSTAGLGLTDRTAPLLAAVGDAGDALARDILAAKQAEDSAPRRGFFVSGAGSFGGEDSGSVPGYDFKSGSLLVGADANLSPDLAVGVMAGYEHTEADPDAGGSITVETARAGLYGTLSGDSGEWINASLGGAYHWHDTRRAALGGVATASPGAAELNASLELGRDFTKDGWTLSPGAGVGYMLLRTEGFDESGSLAPLSIASQTSESLRGELVMTLSRRIKRGSGLWDAWARLGVAHEFLDAQTAVRARLLSGAGGAFSVTGNRAARDSVVFATGIQVAFDETKVAALGYSGDYNPDYRTHGVNASIRIRF